MLIVNKAREAAACAEANCASSFTNATNSATSATNSQNSANDSADSASEANNYLTQVTNIFNDFDERYLGAKAVAPTVDNQGNPLQEGALYYNSTSNGLFVWNGSAWASADFNEFTNFTATGTTTARNLVTRFTDVVNVKDFGAVGDGVTDDTAAIQAAVNAVSANPIGGTLYFADGIYITQEITVGSNIIIEGNGSTLKGKTGQNYIFRLVGLENITIQNFILDCVGLSIINPNPIDVGLRSSAIYVRVGSGLFNNVKILNNRFINIPTTSPEYHAIGFNNVNCIVSNNFSDQCGGDVFNFNGGIIICNNNQIRNGGDGGVAYNNGARGIISDNYIYKCNLGIGCGAVGNTTDPSYNNTLQIDSNTIDSCDWGVNLGWFGFAGREGPENFSVTNNSFYNCRSHAIRYDGRTNTWNPNGVISNNVIYRTGSPDYNGTPNTSTIDIAIVNCGSMVVSNNALYLPYSSTGTRVGIGVYTSSNVVCSGNKIDGGVNAYYDGIYIQDSTNSNFIGNVINSISYGIRSQGTTFGTDLTISNNNIYQNQADGIRLENALRNTDVTNNQINTASNIFGIWLSSDVNRLTVKSNAITLSNPSATTAIVLNASVVSDYYDISFNTVYGKLVTDGGTKPGAVKRVLDNW